MKLGDLLLSWRRSVLSGSVWFVGEAWEGALTMKSGLGAFAPSQRVPARRSRERVIERLRGDRPAALLKTPSMFRGFVFTVDFGNDNVIIRGTQAEAHQAYIEVNQIAKGIEVRR